MQNLKENIIVNKTFDFAIMIVKYCEELELNSKYVIAKQLLRSGTSIGASGREAQNAESKNDFIHKMKIAAKEADECQYWLMICNQLESYPDCSELIRQLEQIIKILSKIIGTTKISLRNSLIFKLSNFQIFKFS